MRTRTVCGGEKTIAHLARMIRLDHRVQLWNWNWVGQLNAGQFGPSIVTHRHRIVLLQCDCSRMCDDSNSNISTLEMLNSQTSWAPNVSSTLISRSLCIYLWIILICIKCRRRHNAIFLSAFSISCRILLNVFYNSKLKLSKSLSAWDVENCIRRTFLLLSSSREYYE